MARFKERSAARGGVRDYLLERYRPLSDRYAALRGCPWHRLVDDLEAGKPVLVRGHALMAFLPDVDQSLQYFVDADDSVRAAGEVER